MKLNRIGIDLAKNVFQLHGVDDRGKVVFRKRLTRDKWFRCFVSRLSRVAVVHHSFCNFPRAQKC